MDGQSIAYWILYFIVTVIIAWIALSIILIWATPSLYNTDGSLNWGTTFWVAAVTILLAWLFLLLIWWIISLWTTPGKCNTGCNTDTNAKGWMMI